MTRLTHLPLAAKTAMISAVAMIAVGLAVSLVSVRLMESEMLRQAQERQEANMRVAWQVIAEGKSDFKIADNRLYSGKTVLNGNDALVDKIKDLVGGTATVFMGDVRVATNVVSADGKRAIGTRLGAGPVSDTVLRDSKPFRGEAEILGKKYFTAYDPITDAGGKVIGILYVGLPHSDFFGSISTLHGRVALWAGGTGAVLILLAYFMIGFQIRPLQGVIKAVKRLQQKDYTTTIPARARHDEIGTLANALEEFRDAMIDAERLRADQIEAEKHADADKKAAMNRLADAFETEIGGIVQTVSSSAVQMQGSAQSLSTTIEQTRHQSTAVAAASEQASANVQTVATAGEELSNSIREISRQVAQSTRIADKAVEDAQRTNDKVQSLSEAALKIGEVVKLISAIAEQTNLLALNATIEAARAGEAGKGFAVVASEVKALANQTAKATGDISQQIAAIQDATRESVGAIQTIGQTIGEMSEISAAISAAVEEQSAATEEIARNIEQAAKGTQEVSTNIGGVTQAAGETGTAASQVLDAAGDLSMEADNLRQQVDDFLAKVRAA